jgi:hypothetical protein
VDVDEEGVEKNPMVFCTTFRQEVTDEKTAAEAAATCKDGGFELNAQGQDGGYASYFRKSPCPKSKEASRHLAALLTSGAVVGSWVWVAAGGPLPPRLTHRE